MIRENIQVDIIVQYPVIQTVRTCQGDVGGTRKGCRYLRGRGMRYEGIQEERYEGMLRMMLLRGGNDDTVRDGHAVNARHAQ